MNFDNCSLQPMTEESVAEICQWEYEKPYDVYSFKGRPNGYLLDKRTWGVEQFVLCCDARLVGQVSCQFDNHKLWVGWSLSPALCGKSNGHLFVQKCVKEIRKIKDYKGNLFLRVAAFNERAIKAYQKAGFIYIKTIKDEIPYSNNMEDFWIMVERISNC